MSNSKTRGRRPARAVRYSSAVAQALCDGLAKGRALNAICRSRAMPCTTTVGRWLETYPEFARSYALALAAGGGPHPGGRPGDYRSELAVAFCVRIGQGEALERICADPAMPSQASFYRWLDRYPEFAALVVHAREVQADTVFDEVRLIADEATPQTLQVARTRIAVRQWQSAKLAPRKGEGARQRLEVEVVRFCDDEAGDVRPR